VDSVEALTLYVQHDTNRGESRVLVSVYDTDQDAILWSVHRTFGALELGVGLADDCLWAWCSAGLIGLASMYESRYAPLTIDGAAETPRGTSGS
jgi:hypothetical protein